jgi:hypothetical protein
LNIHHFGKFEALGLKIMASRSPSMPFLSTEFHIELLIGSKVVMGDRGGETDRQNGNSISLILFLKYAKI